MDFLIALIALVVFAFCLYFVISFFSLFAQNNEKIKDEYIPPNKDFVEKFIERHPINFHPTNKRETLALEELKNAYYFWMHNDFSSARKNFLDSAKWLSNDEIAQYKADCIIGIIASFSNYDPMYHLMLDEIKEILMEKPNILQTEIYSLLRNYSKNDIQYVLYYADFKNDITRKKKGRSYILNLKDEVDVG